MLEKIMGCFGVIENFKRMQYNQVRKDNYKWRNKMLNKLLKSVLDQDFAPVVVCDMDDIIVYR